jgi:preprotein translocase subunit SecF
MNLQFVKIRKYWYAISGLMIAISLVALFSWGFRLGIDFTGGTLLGIDFLQGRPSPQALQEKLSELNLGDVSAQPSGESEMLIRLRDINEDEHQQILQTLKTNFANVPPPQAAKLQTSDVINELRFESIGPIIGQELRDKSVVALLLSLIFIIAYIAYAFRKVSYPVSSWKYGVTAIIALAHDLIIVCGLFSILGHFLNWEINVLFITALLTTLGYSVNDSIVVFDRTRENLFHEKNKEFAEVVNESVNQTMARSINTSFTTLLVLIAIFVFGGESIKEFVLALMAGVFIGTYSSIFIASPLLVDWFQFGKK